MNEKGLTLIELLISMVILITVMTASLNFYENYSYKANELGEYFTAKNLVAKGIEMAREDILVTNNLNDHQSVVEVNGVLFKTEVTKQNVTEQYSVLNNQAPFIRIASKTTWNERELEVQTYVLLP